MRLNENSFTPKLYKWFYGVSESQGLPKNLCPYFWKVLLMYSTFIPYVLFSIPVVVYDLFDKQYENGDRKTGERLGVSVGVYIALFICDKVACEKIIAKGVDNIKTIVKTYNIFSNFDIFNLFFTFLFILSHFLLNSFYNSKFTTSTSIVVYPPKSLNLFSRVLLEGLNREPTLLLLNTWKDILPSWLLAAFSITVYLSSSLNLAMLFFSSCKDLGLISKA